MSKKLTLEELLKWAKDKTLYIEILGDGRVGVQAMVGANGNFETIIRGSTLFAALQKARKYFHE